MTDDESPWIEHIIQDLKETCGLSESDELVCRALLSNALRLPPSLRRQFIETWTAMPIDPTEAQKFVDELRSQMATPPTRH
jgi:hypothetical protein